MAINPPAGIAASPDAERASVKGGVSQGPRKSRRSARREHAPGQGEISHDPRQA